MPSANRRPLDRRAVLGLLAASAIGLPRAGSAESPQVFADGGLAIRGTDPVAYFRDGAPRAGDRGHALIWHGATWLFATSANREDFEMKPAAYAPRYGGYCAYALAKGRLASSVPEAWTIHEGRLYLNYSTGIRDLWRLAIAEHVRAADRYWPAVLG